ncbi:O-antigen polysaccharide polymerase Wzy [Coprobacillus sp. AM37-9BH]|nr:O-antigen polysaccharide polymerase Wzy [Coprobacillus sp. AM37-9BH]
MKINKRNFLLTLMYAIVVLICNIFIFSTGNDESYELCKIGVISVVEFLIFTVINTKINGKFLNYAMIFCSTLYVFNFGQVIIYTFFKNIYPHVRFILLLEKKDAIHGFQWMSLAFFIICLSILFSCIRSKKDHFIKESSRSLDNYIKLSKKIILFTFPVKLIIDIFCLIVSISSGGLIARIWMNSVPYVFVTYGKISLVGFAMLIVSLKNNPKYQKKVFLFIILYILVMMVSGIRSENVGYLLVFIFLFFSSQNTRIPIFLVIIYGVLGILLLAFIIAVGKFRGAEKSFSSFVEIFMNNLTKNNVILSLFDTCGDTGYTTQEVINKWLPYYGCTHGDSFYIGWISIIPNIPKLFTLPGDLTAKTYFALRLQQSGILNKNYTNIGGSLLGELFFNFGLFGGVIASIVVGILIGWVSKKVTKITEGYDYNFMITTIPIMFATIYWVRSYFGAEFRLIIWATVFILLIKKTKFKKK